MKLNVFLTSGENSSLSMHNSLFNSFHTFTASPCRLPHHPVLRFYSPLAFLLPVPYKNITPPQNPIHGVTSPLHPPSQIEIYPLFSPPVPHRNINPHIAALYWRRSTLSFASPSLAILFHPFLIIFFSHPNSLHLRYLNQSIRGVISRNRK